MSAVAIVPQKRLGEAKSRLAGALAPAQRAALSCAMLGHVCRQIRATPGVDALVIVTPDARVRTWAAAWGCAAAPDACAGLNAALEQVLRSPACEGRDALIVAADLPWLRPSDIVALLAARGPGCLVLAPSKDGEGTGALVVPRGVRIVPAFGPASRAAHRRVGARAGLRVVEVPRPGLAFDLDTPEDLATLDSAAWRGALKGVSPSDPVG